MTPRDYMRMKAQETFDYYRSDPSRRAAGPDGFFHNIMPDGRRCAASRLAAEHGVYLGASQHGWRTLRALNRTPPIPGLPDALVLDLLVWHDKGLGEAWGVDVPGAMSAEQILARIDSGGYGDPEVPAPQVACQSDSPANLTPLELVVLGAVASHTPYASWDEAIRAGAVAMSKSPVVTEATILRLIERKMILEPSFGRLVVANREPTREAA